LDDVTKRSKIYWEFPRSFLCLSAGMVLNKDTFFVIGVQLLISGVLFRLKKLMMITENEREKLAMISGEEAWENVSELLEVSLEQALRRLSRR